MVPVLGLHPDPGPLPKLISRLNNSWQASASRFTVTGKTQCGGAPSVSLMAVQVPHSALQEHTGRARPVQRPLTGEGLTWTSPVPGWITLLNCTLQGSTLQAHCYAGGTTGTLACQRWAPGRAALSTV